MRLTRFPTRHPGMYPRLFIAHGPGLILKGEASWRTFNGIGWRTRAAVYFFELREQKTGHWSRHLKPKPFQTWNFTCGGAK